MSYLDMYQSSHPVDTTGDDSHESDNETTEAANTPPVQARYRYHNLTSILAEEIVGALSTTQAIDLSFNAIDQLPRTASPILIALDVSFNAIERPIVLHSGYHLLELNMCNNRITDLKGLALLDSLEFLDVSANLLSRLEGLENMKKLKVLKLQHNKIAAFQSLRLLTYNILLKDVCLEDNPIVDDPYFKVKLINCVPNLKYLDGTTVWRRTSLQSRNVNDDLKYADLCARTPATVQKYANLSRRSGTTHHGEDMLHNLSGSMLTMQGLRNHQNHTNNSVYHTPGPGRALPEQSPLPRGFTRLSDVTNDNRDGYAQSSPKRRHQRPSQVEKSSDIDLLPAHLQAILHKHQRAYASPRRAAPSQATPTTQAIGTDAPPASYRAEPVRPTLHVVTSSSGAGAPWSAADACGAVADAPPRPRSALPWRNPPKLTPNLDVHFKSRQRFDADGRSVATSLGDTPSVSGGAGRATSVTRAGQRLSNSHIATTPQSIARGGASSSSSFVQAPPSAQQWATPAPRYTELVQESVSPLHVSSPTLSPVKLAQAPPAAVQPDAAPTPSQWMNPELNSAIKSRSSAPLDSHMMENAMNSSMFILQQSFEADKRVRSDNGSVASSSIGRGRPRARLEATHSGSDAGVRSVGTSASRGGLRAVTPTKSSVSRANFTNELLRATQDADQHARVLAEARTYTRRTSPSSSPQRARNPAYTYLQGTSSPAKSRDEDIPSYSVRTQPFSPQPAKKAAAATSYRSRSPYRDSQTGSPPKESSTARILEMYREMPHIPDNQSRHVARAPDERDGYEHAFVEHNKHSHEGNHSVHPGSALHISVPPAALKHTQRQRDAQQEKAPVDHAPSKNGHHNQADHLHVHSASDESKERTEQHHEPPPPPPPARTGEESPYNRFLRLRERLSSKYVQSAAETGEFFEPVRTSSGEQENKRERESSAEKKSAREYGEGDSFDVHAAQGQELIPSAQRASAPAAVAQAQVAQASLPQAELSFEQLKDQYQRQYQADYEKQRQEHDSLRASKGMSPKSSFSLPGALASTLQSALASSLTSTVAPTPGSTSSRASTPSRGAADLPPGTVVAPPAVPPRGSGYDALYDLIHQRRSVLEKITQPDELSPDRANNRQPSPERERIGGAISSLKQRQAASVSVIQSATRERTVPAPVHNGLLQVSLSTPALYPSISNYAFMTQSNPPSSGAQGALGAAQNSFMNRLTSNNPYMMPPELTTTVTAAGQVSVAGSTAGKGQGLERVTDLTQSYPAPPPYVPQHQQAQHQQPQQQQQRPSLAPAVSTSAPAIITTAPVAAPPALMMPASSVGGGDLAKAIRELQAKQTRDITALKTH